MTDNDKEILKRWRNAEINHDTLTAIDLSTPGYLLSERSPTEIAVINEQFEAQQALKNIEDADLQIVVARIHQLMPDVYPSDPAFKAAADDWRAAKNELLAIAAKLDPASVN